MEMIMDNVFLLHLIENNGVNAHNYTNNTKSQDF